jgi:hypothetical protein
MHRLTLLLLLGACTADTGLNEALLVEILDFRQVVPGEGLPAEVSPMTSNNNLDVVEHAGRVFLAFRTAPTHFAGVDTKMYVVSSEDENNWRFEGEFALGTDVREPQLVSWGGTLRLYFAVLGQSSIAFEPGGTVWTTYEGVGQWTELQDFALDTFIPWRVKEVNGDLQMIGYTGGENVYELNGEPIKVHWLRSEDGASWEPVIADQPIVHEGGGSETDYVILDDGALVAVMRNEAGENGVFGSLICRAEAADLGQWDCVNDLRKYDSPLLFRHGDGIWLIGRRNVTEDGHYDLEQPGLAPEDEFLHYQVDYWNQPKRCALWTVDPDTLVVDWVIDLPSKGDTCFPEVLETEAGPVVYNYSSDPDGPELAWLEGQLAPTNIYRMLLQFQ